MTPRNHETKIDDLSFTDENGDVWMHPLLLLHYKHWLETDEILSFEELCTPTTDE